MTQQVIKNKRARTIRVTVLDDCCTLPASGTECAIVVFDGFTEYSASAEVEEGLSAFVRKANGDICRNDKDPNDVVHLNLSMKLCQVGPEDVSVLTGWPVTRDVSGRAIGFDIMEGHSDLNLGVEMFSDLSGGNCGDGTSYGYGVFPCTEAWTLDGDIVWGGLDTIQEINLVSVTKGDHAWGKGPYAVQDFDEDATPENLHDAMQTGSHARLMRTTVPPPATTDGCVTADSTNGYLYPTGE